MQTLSHVAVTGAVKGTDRGLILIRAVLLGLFFIQRYSFLTIDQFARVSGMSRDASSRQLRILELRRLLSHFGNVALPGVGRTPKVYYLTRKGWEILHNESDIPLEFLGKYREIKIDARWSPQMYHRLRTVDLMISAECAVRGRSSLSIVKTFLEYRRVKKRNGVQRETTDFVDKEEIGENRIIPDGAFIIENIQTKKRALFFLEMDMGTERIVSFITRDNRITLHHKLSQYDKYLQNGRYKETYKPYGEFGYFTLLFVTLSEERIQNIRREAANLPQNLADYYRFTIFSKAMDDLFGQIWSSRSQADTNLYALVRERAA
jgi:hypothetical protein